MNLQDRISEIDALSPALKSPALVAHLHAEVSRLTAKLVSANDEQARGAIQALSALINLPEALQYERQEIAAELTEQSASA